MEIAKLLDGRKLGLKIKESLKDEVSTLRGKGITPSLVAVQIGKDPSSYIYLKQQKKSCEEIGVNYELKEFPEDIPEKDLLKEIEKLNKDSKITGIIIQMPLPKSLNAHKIQISVTPEKDVEGIHPYNMGMLVYGKSNIAPPTAEAAVELLKSSGIEIKGKEVVIVGRSAIVGKPVALLLLKDKKNSPTPTICHSVTKDMAFHTKRADILIVAVGKAHIIKGDMIKKGAIVIDVGINEAPEDLKNIGKKIVGDVEFDEAIKKASFVSPVPGGVGPLTVSMFLKNIVECAKKIHENNKTS
jgi:methylenetetrahydrofolate dehydrogenase (NADP+) / methenyltetrahydrofolate cyclohydrolase